MKLFFAALGLMLVFEGMPYFAFPERMKVYLSRILLLPPRQLRVIGLASMLAGLSICYIAQRSGLFGP